MGWSDKDWDDYVRGQPYTQFGEIKRQQLRDMQTSTSTGWGSGGGASDSGSMAEFFHTLLNLAGGLGVVYALYVGWPGVAWYWFVAGLFGGAIVADLLQKGPLAFLPKLLAVVWYVVIAAALVGGALYWFGIIG